VNAVVTFALMRQDERNDEAKSKDDTSVHRNPPVDLLVCIKSKIANFIFAVRFEHTCKILNAN
jgi:hypothetical protein